jgi:hypothetical protein
LDVVENEDEDDLKAKRKQIEREVIEEHAAMHVMEHYREILIMVRFL